MPKTVPKTKPMCIQPYCDDVLADYVITSRDTFLSPDGHVYFVCIRHTTFYLGIATTYDRPAMIERLP